MLVVSYTTVSPLPRSSRTGAVCFLWHCPAGHPGLPLATTLPCGVRTFLGPGRPGSRPPCQLVRRLDGSSVPGHGLAVVAGPDFGRGFGGGGGVGGGGGGAGGGGGGGVA